MVDGGVKLRIGTLPLAIQILSAQRTTMTTAEKEMEEKGREKDTVWNRATAREILQDEVWNLHKADCIAGPGSAECVSILESLLVGCGDFL